MTDIFDEVAEDLRRERLKRAWDRFGIYVILVAVLIVALTAGWRGYEWWRVNSERTAGEAYVGVLSEVEGAGTAGSAEALTQFAEGAPDGFALLAEFRAATQYAAVGEADAAREVLSGIVQDGDVPALYRDLARLRLAHVLIDIGDHPQAQETILELAEDAGSPFHRSAQELMGLAAYAADDFDAGRRWFTAVEGGAGTSAAMRERAQDMLGLLDRVAPEPAGTGEEAAPSGEDPASDTASATEETN
ncbi:tetratricopeptide repeat protein [Acuticoccus sp.]|uniref:tetratricopeptide repeat protein n=1 Tax=Acuticoccus sp. TaxID=1904378 RepID=UPI003B52E5AB